MICRVLIVDDEPSIAEGIRVMLKRGMPSCNVIGLAYNGASGYEQALSQKPDIILTDIRMPDFDGIEMIRRLTETGCASKYVILTGYSEFEYAKSAISLGVQNYITKPIDEEELFLTIQKICNDLENNRENRKMKDVLENYGSDIKEYALLQYLEEPFADRGKASLFLKELGIELKARIFCCAVFENNSEADENSCENFFALTKEKIQEYSGDCPEAIVLHGSAHQVFVILGQGQEADERKLYRILCRIRAEISDSLGVPVAVGMGLCHEKKAVGRSLKEAKCALNYKVIRGNAVIRYRDIAEISGETQPIAPLDVKKLEMCIDNMDDDGCRQIVEEIFGKLEKEKGLSPENLQNISLNLILLGVRKMPYIQFHISEYLGKDIFSLENLSKFTTIDQLKNWVINILRGMNNLMIKENMPEKRDVVEEVKRYLSKNFNKNITLNDISEQFFINPYYFSQLFKKRTGDTYQNYVTGLRISRARKLLEETDLKVYEVCEMVGYSNINHFNKIFERTVGLKPREYKETR